MAKKHRYACSIFGSIHIKVLMVKILGDYKCAFHLEKSTVIRGCSVKQIALKLHSQCTRQSSR